MRLPWMRDRPELEAEVLEAALPAAVLPPVAPAVVAPAGPWSPARVAFLETLWGAGFTGPCGAEETLRLVAPLGLSSASSVLLLGAGMGGPGRAISSRLAAYVSGFEADADLLGLAPGRRPIGVERRATMARWDPTAPQFGYLACHHAVVLDAIRHAAPEPVFAALTGVVKPRGQVVMTELVAEPVSRPDGVLEDWLRLDGREPVLPREEQLTRAMARLGFDVRVVEDLTDHHAHLAIGSWHRLVTELEGERTAAAMPSSRLAALVAEGERWLLRLRLMREGSLRLVRWHAIAPG